MKILKVMVCDDSKLLRMNMRDILKKLEADGASVTVLEASNGQEAVELYKSERPDLVFMDITMPVKTGLDALKEILEYDTSAKVVMSSSAGTKEHLKKAITLGAVDFIQKPLEEEKVLTIVRKVLNL